MSLYENHHRLDRSQLIEFESLAIDLAHGSGQILRGYFGTRINTCYKDKKGLDPVTEADKESQKHIAKIISQFYPDHGFLGEEDQEQASSKAPDFVWVVDPLDGTKNFLNRLPVFACSIGLLYHGAPVVGAIYIPWPVHNGGVVLHARKGGGAYIDGKQMVLDQSNKPEGGYLAAFPESLKKHIPLGSALQNKTCELRITGSIAYELAMVAKGVLQYCVVTTPRIWDVAAGTIIVNEAGATTLVESVEQSRWPLFGSQRIWQPLRTFPQYWESGTTTLKNLRDWSTPLVAGNALEAKND